MPESSATVPDVALAGCRPEPLGSYLKALGLFRLIAEQVDADARARWLADELHLTSTLDVDGLVGFLADRYRPTPLVAPWNKGSGFGADDARTSPTNTAAVGLIRDSTEERLTDYRSTIAAIDNLTRRSDWFMLDKEHQVARCRSAVPDGALAWLDASVVLANDRLSFPPLLGTGGNDGRFDFASNFMDRLAQVLGLRDRGRRSTPPHALARAALTGEIVELDRAAIGQFDPGGAGGPGSSSLGAAEALANPWDFILLLEGALVFASGAARRMSGQVATSMPFMVRSSPAGHPSAADAEKQRGELWAPLWSSPASFPEIARLISEGRAEFAGRQATNGLDVARALSTLGVERGLSGFVRHAFLERNGLATFAVPVGRARVAEDPSAAGLTRQLDRWMATVRRVPNPPASLCALVRRVDDLQFALAARENPLTLQRLLGSVAAIDALGATSTAVRSHVQRPLARLSAGDWIPPMDDGTLEHEIAVALASLRIDRRAGLLRQLLTDSEWTGRRAAVDGFRQRPLATVLGDALARIAVEHGNDLDDDHVKRWLPRARAVPARVDAVERFLDGALDERRVGELLSAYGLLDWSFQPPMQQRQPHPRRRPSPPAFALLRPFFQTLAPPDPWRAHGLAPDDSWPRRMLAGGVGGVLADAARRARIAGLQLRLPNKPVSAVNVDGVRLAAACLVPISGLGAASLLSRVAVAPGFDPSTPLTEEPE